MQNLLKGIAQESLSRKNSQLPDLPKEVVEALAHQINVEDVSNFQSIANAYWGMLNDLHENNPSEYNNEIETQVAAGPKAIHDFLITPLEGIFVHTQAMTKELQGLNTMKTFSLFVNICGHGSMQKPRVSRTGQKVDDVKMFERIQGDLDIPLLISPHIRNVSDSESILDVVFHPICILLSKSSHFVRDQLVDLALVWIEKEHPTITFKKLNNVEIKEGYKYSLKNKVTAFPIRKPAAQPNTETKSDTQNENDSFIIESPSGLIQYLKSEKEPSNKELLIEPVPQTKMPLIRSIDQPVPCSFKKGFLNRKDCPNQKPLYIENEKSRHGQSESFFDKCKIVDLKAVKAKLNSDDVSDMNSDDGSDKSRTFDYELEKLCRDLDSDSISSNLGQRDTNEIFLSKLREMNEQLQSPPSEPEDVLPSLTNKAEGVIDSTHHLDDFVTTIKKEQKNNNEVVEVTFLNSARFPDKMKMSHIQLNLSDSSIDIQVQQKTVFTIPLENKRVDLSDFRAKFIRKRRCLSISMPPNSIHSCKELQTI